MFTHTKQTSAEKIQFVTQSPVDLLRKLRAESGKGIWICGGANLIQQILSEDFIDQYYISVIPVLLGDWIRLFEKLNKSIELRLVKTQHYNGITDLIYIRRSS